MRYIFLFILCFIYTITLAQRVKGFIEPSPKQIIESKIIDECSFTNKYSTAQRLSFYPFNKAKNVILISFKEDQGIPVKKQVVDEKQVLEQITLTQESKDSLTSILYNVGFTPVKRATQLPSGEASCYEPRNGILFVNEASKAFEYIEICFACERKTKSSDRINDGQYCSTKYDLLRRFFLNNGIKYGTGERDPVKSYNDIFKLDTSFVMDAIKNKIERRLEGGKDINTLSKTEQILFFAINSYKIYSGFSGQGLSGLAEFYLDNSGSFYQKTLAALQTISAYRTYNVLNASKIQWPKGKIPEKLATRRTELIKMINVANPQWKLLEKGLFDYHDVVGAQYCIPKEDLDVLIYNFAALHRSELID
ncbi:hypothetical protein HDF18_05025 [Mucilaginibacter sp. X5P1]|uniref:hypothetical protein n=1 Tax=Mucilaginibacter sp. X5P1 TaxID=2723088 RepID=UPI001614C0B7|nr:hypothetical protein [Mucilaginibacter sp. X5P1]MBB6136987.1 hypothetical protein [Mucilaginibacter sp. X5P1]